ncbi:hypothetical protein CHF27_013585, partial [Romboutsia maritimum]
MLNGKKISPIILMIILSLLIVQLVFADKNPKSEKLEDLSIQQLTEIRDKDIDQNVEYLKEFGADSKEVQDCKDEILNCDAGLVAFYNK